VNKEDFESLFRLLTFVLFVVLIFNIASPDTKPGSSATPDWILHVVSPKTGGPDGVRLADVNGDGLQDVVTAYESSGDIMIFLHPGFEKLGEEWPSIVVGNEARGEDAFAIDLNGDGNMDIFSSHEGDTLGLFVHWAPSNPDDYFDEELWVSERILVADGHGWMFAVPMDVNEDGKMDIVAGSKDDFFNDRNSIGELAWLETPIDDQEGWQYHVIDHVGWPMSLEPIDMDQDGDLDVLVSDRKADEEHQGLRWLENPGKDWDEEWESHFVSDLEGARPMFLGIGDLDGDGRDDLAVPIDQINEVFLVSLIDQGKMFTIAAVFGQGNFKGAGIADVDLDGAAEIVMSTEGGNVGVGYFDRLPGSSQNIWTWEPIFDALENPKYDLIALYDVDGDGDLDFLTTEERQGLGVIWFENPAIIIE
jgi:hypothetical protein